MADIASQFYTSSSTSQAKPIAKLPTLSELIDSGMTIVEAQQHLARLRDKQYSTLANAGLTPASQQTAQPAPVQAQATQPRPVQSAVPTQMPQARAPLGNAPQYDTKTISMTSQNTSQNTQTNSPDKPKSKSQEANEIKKFLADMIAEYGSVGVKAAFDNKDVTLNDLRARRAQEALDAEKKKSDVRQSDLPLVAQSGALHGVQREATKPPENPGVMSKLSGAASAVGSAVSNVGKFITDPRGQYKLGSLAAAIGGVEDPRLRKPLGQRLGSAAAQSAQQKVMSRIVNGEQVDPSEAAILSPEQLAQVANILTERGRLDATNRQIGVAERQTDISQQAADTGRLTAESNIELDKARIEQIKSAIGAPDNVPVPVNTGTSIKLMSYDKKTGKWTEDKSYKATEKSADNGKTRAESFSDAYGSTDIKLIENHMTNLFYDYARAMQKPGYQMPTEPEALGKEVAGAIRRDPALAKSWDNLMLYAQTLMDGNHTIVEVMNLLTQAAQTEGSPTYMGKGIRPTKTQEK